MLDKLVKRGIIVKGIPINKPLASKLLILLHGFLGIGAVGGGAVLIIDPSGELIRMPITILESSPFNSFLVPGIILFAVLGVFPLIIAVALATKWQWKAANRLNFFTDKHWSWTFSLYIGFALISWIAIQLFYIKEAVLIHIVYIFLGLIIQAVTLLPSVQKQYLR